MTAQEPVAFFTVAWKSGWQAPVLPASEDQGRHARQTVAWIPAITTIQYPSLRSTASDSAAGPITQPKTASPKD